MAKRALPRHIQRMLNDWARKQSGRYHVVSAQDLAIIGWALATAQEYVEMLEDDEYDHAEIMEKHELAKKRITKAMMIVPKLL